MIARKLAGSGLAVVLALLVCPLQGAEEKVFKKSVKGTPKLEAIDVIRFGPRGLLLIGDGRGSQILAVDTRDTKPTAWDVNKIDNIKEKLAGKIGTTAKGIEIIHLAVNPASKVAYVGIRKQDGKKPLILTIDGKGKIGEFVLEDVTYARVVIPPAEQGAINLITDVTWAGDQLLASGRSTEKFASKILSVPAPLEHEAKAGITSAETYHVAHGRWETRAPMHVILPFEEDNKRYLVGAFTCTPLVKYPLDDLKPNAKVKGISMLEVGNGNMPRDIFMYEKQGKHYILMNTYRFFKPFGPSKYWTVRLERDILRGKDKEKVNEKALRRLDRHSKPATDRVKMIEEYHGVVNMDRLDAKRALVLREGAKGALNLEALPLP